MAPCSTFEVDFLSRNRYHWTGWIVSVRVLCDDQCAATDNQRLGRSFYSQRGTKSMVSSVVLQASTPVVCTISTRTSMNVSSLNLARHDPPFKLRRPQQIQAPLRRSQRQHQSRLHHRPGPAHRGVQPRRPIPRQSLFRDGRIHGRRRWAGHAALA
jgi:hypothetical protein